MTIPVIAYEDLECLVTAFPDLDFSDPECRAVLLAANKVDVQAAPGSGKTTILAAKLYLLSRKWTSERQGVCVISHTNTAAHEIRHRLAGTSEGARLLAYPHFIGTIHGFINQYLALPWLRSRGGIVEAIDDEVFSRKALWAAKQDRTVKGWANRQHNGDELISKMRLSGPALTVVSGTGFPSDKSDSGKYLRKVKKQLASEGIFRHIDLFAYAAQALEMAPRLTALLARRFPLVMIDEMQDTSASQTALLANAFGGGALIQRFGDINQRIFSDDDDDGDVPFPEAPSLPMRSSRRFGPVIAGIVSKVQQEGSPVVGEGPDAAVPPTLLVYQPDAIERVIERFGQLVLEAFDDPTIASGGPVRAICARKSSDSQQLPGRHVGDFWPPLAIDPKKSAPAHTNAWRMLGSDGGMGLLPVELGDRTERVKRIVLLALRQAGAPIATHVREPWRLFRSLRDSEFDLPPLRRAMRQVVMDEGAGSTGTDRAGIISAFHSALEPLMPGITHKKFAGLTVFADPAGDGNATAKKTVSQSCLVSNGDRSVTVRVDTVGMTKGETHLATLYLESIGYKSGRFDVIEAIARMAGRDTTKGKPLVSLPAQLRYAYVGFSRPTRFLCLAANGERLDAGDIKALISSGWRVERIG
jgi:hypothetical protein